MYPEADTDSGSELSARATLQPEDVDPWIGTEPTDLPNPQGLAARWFLPKAQIGNTHPGAVLPHGMVSVCPYSGAYVTGYGLYRFNTSGQPRARFSKKWASGFTHFHPSGTGAIRRYYNYIRVTPLVESIAQIGKRYELKDESAAPGMYSCRLGPADIGCEVSVGRRSAVHRYRFPAGPAKIAIDLAVGGLDEDDKRSLPTAMQVQMTDAQSAQGWIEVEGQKLYFAAATNLPVERSGLWYGDARCGQVGGMMALSAIDHDHFKPFGFFFSQPEQSGGDYELHLGFSWASAERALNALHASRSRGFDIVAAEAEHQWRQHLSVIEIDGATPEQRTVFASALYHAGIKPIDCTGDGPFWQGDEPCWLDFATLWDQYKTLLPLQYLLWPERGGRMVQSLLGMAHWRGEIPICQLVSEELGLFTNQASALGHITIAEACMKGVPGVDWRYALQVLNDIFPAGRGQDFIDRGFATPFTHTLDLADASAGMAQLAAHVGESSSYKRYQALAQNWRNAYNDETHRLDASNCYEGGLWNYSFRLAQCMDQRIDLYPSEEDFVADLDKFFGYGQPPVDQLSHRPYGDLYDKGIASNSFEGLNNEPDMETPYAYIYAGRHDRTCEVVRTIVDQQFHAGRGGIPGNEDSGALSSWYVWSVLGLFPVAGTDIYLIGTPRFPWARMSLHGGTLEIVAPEASASNFYVESARLNGVELTGAWVHHRDICHGGVLELTMSDQPTDFGCAARPPSFGAGA